MSINDPEKFSENMMQVAQRAQEMYKDFLNKQTQQGVDIKNMNMDPFNAAEAFVEMGQKLMQDPQKLMQAQAELFNGYMKLWEHTAQRMMGNANPVEVVPGENKDRRFKDADWNDNEVFHFIKESYLLTANWMHDTVTHVDGMNKDNAAKVDFYTRQMLDAAAPTNFAMTNPEVLRATMESNGENLVKGFDNLLKDMEKGKGKLRISMTDMEAFTLGENIATTPGKVVFQTPLMQLIQYQPTTEKVYKKPLMIVPPWINKFYILDLQPSNSFIKYAVDQGHTVFVLSWVNPDEELRHKSFEDYMKEGPLAALDAIEKITGSHEVNAVGYCLGGTLLACTMAYLAAHKDERISSGTFFTTLLDFAEAGELRIFIDEKQISSIEEMMDEHGYLAGSEMAGVFSMLRANDLIWSFVIKNYLLGQEPFPFDLLYWNSDSTRMPAAMHSFYLRNMYQDNLLKEPGGITLNDTPIDLGNITCPAYMLSAAEDHIAPWKATYNDIHLMGGKNRFVLGGSGHIAGVVNPPAKNKYGYWTNDKAPATSDEWFAEAEKHEGSWWVDWTKWIGRKAGRKEVPAEERIPGNGPLPALEDAPGSYVANLVQD